jgi:hypothetical protein
MNKEQLKEMDSKILAAVEGFPFDENNAIFYLRYDFADTEGNIPLFIRAEDSRNLGRALFQLAAQYDFIADTILRVSASIVEMEEKLKEEEINISKLN